MMKHVYILLFFIPFLSLGQIAKSPFNGETVEVDSLAESYSFMASGHFHGSGANVTGYPTNSLLANIDGLNNSESAFVICLGDLFLGVSNDIPFYERSFFRKLKIPLFNVVGNHDISGDIYQEHFGKTDFLFTIHKDLHLFFDTESNNGSFSDAQLKTLESAAEQCEQGLVNRVFIYCHRTVWAKHYEAMDGLFSDNTQAVLGNNFSDDVYPLLKKISKYTEVYWFSGSLGGAPASFFYHEDEDCHITYIATAIRGYKRDAWLKVTLHKTGEPIFETISLTGQTLLDLKSYNTDFWKTHSGEEPFNYRLIYYYTKLILLHRAFWYGVLTTLLVTLLVWWRLKIRRRKKQLLK